MLSNLQKQDFQGDSIQELKQYLESEKQFVISQNQISYLQPQQQLQMHEQIISCLNSYLIGLTNRNSQEDNLIAIQAIKYLCRTQADIEVKKFGSFYCGYCFEKFQQEELETELFNTKAANHQQKLSIFTLQCGHTFHFNCFQELTKDFKETAIGMNHQEQTACECPSCELGQESCIYVKDFFRFESQKDKNEQN
ncbi:hypothetical protein ABPG72_009803 [Tetrahymena utriculariae]